jgi:outer membrane receptor for ferrienterochelin and colicins
VTLRARHLVALAVAMLAADAHAEGTADLQGLLDQTVVTTASKSAEKESDAPATSTTITAEELRRFGIHSLDEAIDFLSVGAVTSNPLGQVDIGARGVMIPGDRGAHFLLLVDGHAVNEPLYGMARFDRGAGMPLELVDRIEVILGPGSVLYGSNAMFGVINVITKRAKHFAGLHVSAESEIGKSYRAAAGAGMSFTAFGTPGELTLAAEYYRQKGPTFSYDRQSPTANDVNLRLFTRYSRTGPADGIWGGDATESYYSMGPAGHARLMLGNVEINLHAASFKQGLPYTKAGLVVGAVDFNEPDNNELDRTVWADLKYHATLSRTVSLAMRLYADGRDEQRQYVSNLLTVCPDATLGYCRYDRLDGRYEWPGVSRWLGLDLQTSADWLADGSLVTTLGADARTGYVGSKLDTLDYTTGAAAGPTLRVISETDRTLGVYLQQIWRPAPPFSLNWGARVDAGRGYASVASPRAAVVVETWQGATLKGIFAEAFRAPTWDERLGQDATQVAPSVRPNNAPCQHECLKPERVTSGEVSLEQRLGAQRIQLSGYRSRWTDLIENHSITIDESTQLQAEGKLPPFSVSHAQFRNLSAIDDWGMDLSFEGSLVTSQLRYGLGFTGAYARAELAGRTVVVPVAPRYFGNARIAYDFLGPWPTLALAAHWLARRPADRINDGAFATPPYAPSQMELRATLSGPVPALHGLSYRASVDYAASSIAPYVVGIHQGYFPGDPSYLAPVDQFRTTVGLQYDLDP